MVTTAYVWYSIVRTLIMNDMLYIDVVHLDTLSAVVAFTDHKVGFRVDVSPRIC